MMESSSRSTLCMKLMALTMTMPWSMMMLGARLYQPKPEPTIRQSFRESGRIKLHAATPSSVPTMTVKGMASTRRPAFLMLPITVPSTPKSMPMSASRVQSPTRTTTDAFALSVSKPMAPMRRLA